MSLKMCRLWKTFVRRFDDLHFVALKIDLVFPLSDTQAMTAMRAVYPNSTTFPLYLHDGFDLDRFSNYVANRADFVVQDHHSYFVFTPQDDSEPASQHTSDIDGGIADSLQAASNRQRRNLVIDEFSCALTSDSLKNESDPNQARMEFCTGQTEVYANATAGWSFWGKRGCKGSRFVFVMLISVRFFQSLP